MIYRASPWTSVIQVMSQVLKLNLILSKYWQKLEEGGAAKSAKLFCAYCDVISLNFQMLHISFLIFTSSIGTTEAQRLYVNKPQYLIEMLQLCHKFKKNSFTLIFTK